MADNGDNRNEKGMNRVLYNLGKKAGRAAAQKENAVYDKRTQTKNARRKPEDASENQTPVQAEERQSLEAQQQQVLEKEEKIKLGHRILYTILCPVMSFIGIFIGFAITQHSSSGTVCGIIMVAYLIFSEVMVWKLKNQRSVLIGIMFLNLVVCALSWALLAH